ncbi:alpha/beta hydrolase [Candidatus Finniella inopinata]|uniref:Phospholipase n=1 Tax=Candidatus Finniella inopinata TaxID=1696036 RepID=A0A4Q7DIB8_9PROT|nr:alpha/beta fold hydrolase [Candidatus Finniella inopinata]RZI46452.1 phospholipase [Candidatus Finniella inopinata]
MVTLQGPVHIPPKADHKGDHKAGRLEKLVVLVHGYGASGDNLLDLSYHWQDSLPNAFFAAPNAPETCEVNPFGYQWFGLPDLSPVNIRLGLDRATPVLQNYLQQLMTTYQLAPQDVAVVGFSQGAMIALDMMFLMPTLAGVIGYSGVFLPPKRPSSPPQTKALLVHGTLDMVVPYSALIQSQSALKDYGVSFETHTCHGLDHSISPDGIQVGRAFLNQVLYPAKGAMYA